MHPEELREIRTILSEEVIEVAKIRLLSNCASNESVTDAMVGYLNEANSAVDQFKFKASKGKFLFKKLSTHTKKLAQFNKLRFAKVTSNIGDISQLSRIGIRYDINPEIKIDDIRQYLPIESDSVLNSMTSASEGLEKLSVIFSSFKEFMNVDNHEDSDLERFLANLEINNLQIGSHTYDVDYEAREILEDEDYYRYGEIEHVTVESAMVSDFAKSFKRNTRKYTALITEIGNYSPDFDKMLKRMTPTASSYDIVSDTISIYQMLVINIMDQILGILVELSSRIKVVYDARINRQGLVARAYDQLTGPKSSGRFEPIN